MAFGMDSKLVWGAIIVLFGLSIILKEVFSFNIPVFKVVFGLFLIYLGGKTLYNAFGQGRLSKEGEGRSVVFGRSSIAPEFLSGSYSYDNVFGSQFIDLSQTRLENDFEDIEVNTVFGNTVLILPQGYPAEVEANSVFGSTVLPNTRSQGLGDKQYSIEGQDGLEPIRIETNTVFGKTEIRQP